jgi:hypothetical protein
MLTSPMAGAPVLSARAGVFNGADAGSERATSKNEAIPPGTERNKSCEASQNFNCFASGLKIRRCPNLKFNTFYFWPMTITT